MKIEEFVLINGWLFVEKEGQRENPRSFFYTSDCKMHSLSEAHQLINEYRDFEKLQPERLNPETLLNERCDSLNSMEI